MSLPFIFTIPLVTRFVLIKPTKNLHKFVMTVILHVNLAMEVLLANALNVKLPFIFTILVVIRAVLIKLIKNLFRVINAISHAKSVQVLIQTTVSLVSRIFFFMRSIQFVLLNVLQELINFPTKCKYFVLNVIQTV